MYTVLLQTPLDRLQISKELVYGSWSIVALTVWQPDSNFGNSCVTWIAIYVLFQSLVNRTMSCQYLATFPPLPANPHLLNRLVLSTIKVLHRVFFLQPRPVCLALSLHGIIELQTAGLWRSLELTSPCFPATARERVTTQKGSQSSAL